MCYINKLALPFTEEEQPCFFTQTLNVRQEVLLRFTCFQLGPIRVSFSFSLRAKRAMALIQARLLNLKVKPMGQKSALGPGACCDKQKQ